MAIATTPNQNPNNPCGDRAQNDDRRCTPAANDPAGAIENRPDNTNDACPAAAAFPDNLPRCNNFFDDGADGPSND